MSNPNPKLSRRDFLRLLLPAVAVIRLPLVFCWHTWRLDSGLCLDCGMVIG